MYKSGQIIYSIVILILAVNILSAQPDKIKQIDSLLMQVNERGIFNGNALVAKEDKIIYSASFGYADASKKNKLTADHRFSIGSINKELSAVSIIMLQEQGKLKLDDKISKFIPSLPGWADKVSIKDLLEYTSGLPDINWATIKNEKDIFNDLMKLDTLSFEPGANYYYNNNTIVLRQFVIEKITGLPFNTYAENYLLKPCSMTSSLMNPSYAVKNIAVSFTDDFTEDRTDAPYAGIIFITAGDLFKWLQCLHHEKLITKQSLFQIGQSFNGKQSGLGKADFKNRDLVRHYHHGQSINFEALVYTDVKEKISILLLTNNKKNNVFEIAAAIESILKGEAWKIPKMSASYYLAKQLDSLRIDDFISLYQHLKNTKSNELNFDELELNAMGYNLLSKKRVDDAIKLFDLNVRQFPYSGDLYDSLGEAFYIKGDFKQALFNYKKSLELDPKNDHARQIIEKIEKAN